MRCKPCDGGPNSRARLHTARPCAALTTQQVGDRGWVCAARCSAVRRDAMRGEEGRRFRFSEPAMARPQHLLGGLVHGPRRAPLRYRACAVVLWWYKQVGDKYRYSRSPGKVRGTAVLQEPGRRQRPVHS